MEKIPKLVPLLIVLAIAGCAEMNAQWRRDMTSLGVIHAPAINIVEVSTDPTYGYTRENPIKVGGHIETGTHKNQYTYLNQLAGPDNSKLLVRRKGPCCPFSAPSGFQGMGLLDVWEIGGVDDSSPKTIYLNSYEYVAPKAPLGLTIRTNTSPEQARSP